MRSTLCLVAVLAAVAFAASSQVAITICSHDGRGDINCTNNCTTYSVAAGGCFKDPEDSFSSYQFNCNNYPKCFTATHFGQSVNCSGRSFGGAELSPCGVCAMGHTTTCGATAVTDSQCEGQDCSGKCTTVVTAPLGQCTEIHEQRFNGSVLLGSAYSACNMVNVTGFFGSSTCAAGHSFSYEVAEGTCDMFGRMQVASIKCVASGVNLPVLDARELGRLLRQVHHRARNGPRIQH